MKIILKTSAYEIEKLPFDSDAKITVYDFDKENCEVYKKLWAYINDLESEINDLRDGKSSK